MIARGIERRAIFEDDSDRDDLLTRLASIVRNGGLFVYAWALMPNHFHLLVRTGVQPLQRSMRALLSGYATRFNRRHDRAGHLFQNRYKSTVCEDEPYFLTLVRYIHRNPIPSVVPDVDALASYPYSGHAALLGVVPREWQSTAEVLRRFGQRQSGAILRYLDFMKGDDASGHADLDGGGLRRSQGTWTHVPRLEKGRERFRSDERILGRSAFVEQVRRELPSDPQPRHDLEDLARRVCCSLGLSSESIRGNGRVRSVCQAREGIAYLWTLRLGGSNRALARYLGLAESPVHRAARRGAQDALRWDPLLKDS